VRRILAITAALGFSASLGAFIGSFLSLTLDKMGKWIFLLHGGALLLFLPMFAIEYPGIRANVFFGKEFERGKPRWILFGIKVSFILFFIVFVLFLVLSRTASPEIQSGQYVLSNHGKIVRVLSESEYLHLKEWELRMFASGWMCFYLPIATYWWYPKSRRLIFGKTAATETSLMC
jgi:hypothetical protein